MFQNEMYPEEQDFDQVIEALERGTLPPLVDRFLMKVVYDPDPSCGTAACLYGSAALVKRLRYGQLDDNGSLWREFDSWKPVGSKMKTVQLLCSMGMLDADEVVAVYRAIGQDGVVRLPIESVNLLSRWPRFGPYTDEVGMALDWGHLSEEEFETMRKTFYREYS